MIKKEKKVLFIDIIFHSDDEIDDDDYSLSSEDTDEDLFNYRALTDREKKTKKNSHILEKYHGKSFVDKDDDYEYTGIVTDVVIETSSGDLCFEYNMLSGDVAYNIMCRDIL